MPFNPINFASLEPQGIPWLNNFVTNLSEGYKAGALPGKLARDREAEEAKNKMAKLLLEEQPEKFQSELSGQNVSNALNQARIGEINQKASLPFGGNIAPGAVGQAMWLGMIKNKYGEESPEYQNAKEAYQTEIAKTQFLNQYRGALTQTTDKRTATTLGKTQLELADIDEGFMPGTGRTVQLAPEQQQVLRNQYALKLQKDTSDSSARQKTLYASNIDKTLGNINVDDLVRYGGIGGAISKGIEQGKASIGMESKEYDAFEKSLVAADTLAKQVRQFYGDSIQPSMLGKLEMLVNPASWKNNPKIAKQNFETIKNILQQETGTYRNALQGPQEYRGNSTGSNSNNNDPLGIR